MKFTKKATNLVILLVVLCSMISSFYGKKVDLSLETTLPKVNLNLKTNPSDWGNQNIFYLDRQRVSCPAKSAIDGFKLFRPSGNTLSYLYSCKNNCDGMKSGKTYNGATRLNATNGNKQQSANYLDRHHVICKNGYALQSFVLGRSGNNINYKYTCTEAMCKTRGTMHTAWTSAGRNEVIYLDRQSVRIKI
jgi:hypothetical protein